MKSLAFILTLNGIILSGGLWIFRGDSPLFVILFIVILPFVTSDMIKDLKEKGKI